MIVCLDADCTIYFVEQNPVARPRGRAAQVKLGVILPLAATDLSEPGTLLFQEGLLLPQQSSLLPV